MGMCKILVLRWSCVYCLGPYMGTVTSGPKMGTCKILGPRWSCVYCLGPYMDTVTSGPKMGTCKSGSPDGLVYTVVDLTWALWHLDLWWACVKFWAPDGLVYAVLDLTWALWHWTCRGPTKETILLWKNSGPMMVIQNWPPPNWTKLCHNVDFYLYFH